MIDLVARLTEVGDLLDLPADAADGTELTARVLARTTPNAAGPHGAGHGAGRGWRIAAVLLVVLVGVVAAVPSSRDTVSGWLGLDRVTIERRGDRLPAPATATPPTEAGPDGEPIVVDGRTILVGAIDARLSDAFITKTVAVGAPVRSLDIDGAPALWVESPHDVAIVVDGATVVERVAASTLLWQDGAVLRRVEGFTTLEEAIAFARSR